MLRVKFEPEAMCENPSCSFEGQGPYARNRAQQHVKRTGHTVHVIIEDSTTYSPERQS